MRAGTVGARLDGHDHRLTAVDAILAELVHRDAEQGLQLQRLLDLAETAATERTNRPPLWVLIGGLATIMLAFASFVAWLLSLVQ